MDFLVYLQTWKVIDFEFKSGSEFWCTWVYDSNAVTLSLRSWWVYIQLFIQSYIGVSQQLWSQLSRPLQYIGEIVYIYVYWNFDCTDDLWTKSLPIRMLNLLCDRSIKLHGLILFDYFFLSLRKWYINTQMKKNNKMNFKKFHDLCSYCGLGNLIVWYICRCICPREYTGRHCEELYVPCQPSPCRNGGTCIPSGGLSYQCICQSGRFSTRKEQSSTASTPLSIASTPLNIAVCYLGYMGTLK